MRAAGVVQRVARDKGVTPAQIALAWVLAQGEHIAPIPGTKRRRYLEENWGALDVSLAPGERAALAEAFPDRHAAGPRYGATHLALLDR